MSARSPTTSTRVLGSTTSDRSCSAASGASSPEISTISTSGLGILRSSAVAWRTEARRSWMDGTSSAKPSWIAFSLSESVIKPSREDRSAVLTPGSPCCVIVGEDAMIRNPYWSLPWLLS